MSKTWFGMSPEVMISRLRSLAADLEAVAADEAFQPEKIIQIEHQMIARRTVPMLVGVVTDHPYIEDGAVATTTELFYMDEDRGIARTFNHWYKFSTSPLN